MDASIEMVVNSCGRAGAKNHANVCVAAITSVDGYKLPVKMNENGQPARVSAE